MPHLQNETRVSVRFRRQVFMYIWPRRYKRRGMTGAPECQNLSRAAKGIGYTSANPGLASPSWSEFVFETNPVGVVFSVLHGGSGIYVFRGIPRQEWVFVLQIT